MAGIGEGEGLAAARERASRAEALAEVASSLLSAEGDALAAAIHDAIERLGRVCGADRAYVLTYDAPGRAIELTTEWCREGIDPVGGDFDTVSPAVERWWAQRVMAGLPIVIRALDEVGADGDPDGVEARALLARQQVRALLVVPLLLGGRPRGSVGVTAVDRPYPFADDVAVLLQLAGQLVVSRLERARAEAALKTMSSELALRNEDLERSNRQLEEFAYVASHDLKSPLLVVRGFLDLLEREKGGPLSHDAQSYVAAAIRGATRMERLIDDLLTYSRVGGQPLELENVDLGELVGWVIDDSEVQMKATGTAVDVGDLPVVRADRTQLTQVVQNLLGNAVKFRRPDVAPFITIGAERRGPDWVISIQDNGVGISPAEREKVFGMFTRLDATADRPGSGIGLAIAQRVMEAHHGHLWIEGDGQDGTTFCFSLPA